MERKKDKKIISWIMIIVAICIFGGVVFLSVKMWFLGDDESDYDIICLGGHEYYRANFLQKGFMAIRMTGEGKPVQCQK